MRLIRSTSLHNQCDPKFYNKFASRGFKVFRTSTAPSYERVYYFKYIRMKTEKTKSKVNKRNKDKYIQTLIQVLICLLFCMAVKLALSH